MSPAANGADHQGFDASGSQEGRVSPEGFPDLSAGKDKEADAVFERAEDLAARIEWSDAYDLYLSYRAFFERQRGQLDDALAFATESADGRLIRYGRNATALAHSRFIQSGVLMDIGELDQARGLANQVLSIHQRNRNYANMAFAYARLGEIEYEAGRHEAAAEAFDEAEYLTRLLFGDGANLAMLRSVQAKIAVQSGDLEAARTAYRDMAEIASSMRREGQYLNSSDLTGYLDLLLNSAESDSDALSEAFEVVQLARSTVVDKAMRQMTARLAAGDPEISSAVRQLQDARSQGRQIRQQLGERRLERTSSGENDPAIANLEMELAQIEGPDRGAGARRSNPLSKIWRTERTGNHRCPYGCSAAWQR